MLVEDEQLLSQSIARHIKALDIGFKVVCQPSNGKEALSMLRTNDIHLIMTDIQMPVMGGLELARLVHEQYPHIITIILTGYADFSYAREALKQNVFDYLLKPVNPEELETSLLNVSLQLQKYYEYEEDASMIGKDSHEIAEYAVRYIREHYMDDIDFTSLSAKMGFSSAYLTKIFNKYIGNTPSKYLTDIRIHEAKHLLLNTSLPIREIGGKVGYPDQFHFSKTFRRLTGRNPTAYRKAKTPENPEIK